MSLNLAASVFLVSPTANIFTAIGCRAVARLNGLTSSTYSTGCITTCTSVDGGGKDGESCSGQGCCQASLAAGLSKVSVLWGKDMSINTVPNNTCQYAFVAMNSWYVLPTPLV
jgi:hypothetical protein